jgi:hypothetical protein
MIKRLNAQIVIGLVPRNGRSAQWPLRAMGPLPRNGRWLGGEEERHQGHPARSGAARHDAVQSCRRIGGALRNEVTAPLLLIAALVSVTFLGFWLFVTGLLGLVSGWFTLAHRYPDRAEAAILKMAYLSGKLGVVRVNGALKLSTCRSGFRVGMMRLIGPFSRDFFVPWEEITVVRRDVWLAGSQAELCFGSDGRLTIPAFIADKLAASVPDRWPEADFRKVG